MSETDELFASVNYIKNKVDALEKIDLYLLRSKKEYGLEMVNLLKSDSLLCAVYKSIDGKTMQKDIAAIVNTTPMTVSNKIKILQEHGLIEIKDICGSQKIYQHSVMEKAFHISTKI